VGDGNLQGLKQAPGGAALVDNNFQVGQNPVGMSFRNLLLPGVCAVVLTGCGGDNAAVLADAANDVNAAGAAKALLVGHAGELHNAVVSLCATAPLPPVFGWSVTTYPAAVDSMRVEWMAAHQAYQGLEGAVSLLFPALAASLDGRYEQALAAGPDEDLFDGKGFVGLHAVERILWADAPPPTAETALAGYKPASFPTASDQPQEFRYDLCARLVMDVETLQQQLGALDLGSPNGYDAALRLVERQVTKMVEAGDGFDESRYSNTTLADMRADVAAARATHEVFVPWLSTKPEGFGVELEAAAGFAQLEAAYDGIPGGGLPAVPPVGWSAVDPSAAAAESPFGQLFVTVSAASDVTLQGSLAGAMGTSATLMGIAE
jgi:iron uptake system component EfeO